MRILDLFCKAGGCSVGYHRAGFEVEGVDIEPQPNYPFQFHQMDALEFLDTQDLSRFDAIHASPPCQAHSWAAKRWINSGLREYPDLIEPVRERLERLGKPYVMENVVGATLQNTLVLCGTMFDLKVIRHRLFESNVFLWAPGICNHKGSVSDGDYVTVAGHGGDGIARFDVWCEAMGIDWMTKQELTQAIPPAYTEWIGRQLIEHIKAEPTQSAQQAGIRSESK